MRFTSVAAGASKLARRDDLIDAPALTKQWQDALRRYREIRRASPPPCVDPDVVPPTFKACANLGALVQGATVHADVVKMGFDSFTSTGNTMMSFYVKCGMTDAAAKVFAGMRLRDSVSWNVMIHGFLSVLDDPEAGLNLFKRARASNFEPNVSAVVLVAQACWRLDNMDEGLLLHGLIVRNGFTADVSVQNSLITMYAKCQDMHSARQIFNEIGETDVISWSALISGYAQSESPADALRLFWEMTTENMIHMDGLTAVSVLQACSSIGEVCQGRLFHGYMIRRGLEDDLFVGNSLVDMYSKCGDVDSAYWVFHLMLRKNVVSWNSMISGLVQNEKHNEAVELFSLMEQTGVASDEVTLVNLLQSCKKLGQAVWCMCVHTIIIKNHFLSNTLLLNSLLDAYAKCNLMEFTIGLFHQMDNTNVISWSIIIAGLVYCGKPDMAISFFTQMCLAGEKPNPVTMLSLLEACGSLADLRLSRCAHGAALRNALTNELAVGTAILDMYAKCGDLNASRKVFQAIPERNILLWNAMIGALGMNGCAREALTIFHEMELENVEPNEVTYLSVMSACNHGGLLQEGLYYFQRMAINPFLQPGAEHYSCMVDMFGRAGNLVDALELIKSMPEGRESPAAWGALLSACRSHGNSELGQEVASRVIELEPSSSAGYLLVSSMHAKDGSKDEIARMRLLMKKQGVKIKSGYSLVSVDKKSYKFLSWDSSHPKCKDIYSTVALLHHHMKSENDSKSQSTFGESIRLFGES